MSSFLNTRKTSHNFCAEITTRAHTNTSTIHTHMRARRPVDGARHELKLTDDGQRRTPHTRPTGRTTTSMRRRGRGEGRRGEGGGGNRFLDNNSTVRPPVVVWGKRTGGYTRD